MAVHEITAARSGSGKSAFIVFRLVTDWLPFPHNRNFFTNIPIHIDKVAEYFLQYHPEIVSKSVTDRVKLFNQETTDSWLAEKSGPWEYFHDQDIDAGRIVIDEVHNYVHIHSSKEYVQKWRQWLGELRHCGCSFEAISQAEMKIHPLIRHEAGLMRRLSAADDKRDPVFWVKMSDHYQLLSKIRGSYSSRVFFTEYTEENAKWTKTGGGSFPLIPRYYNLYNSYSAPIAKGGKAAVLSPHAYARMSWPELLTWYLERNFSKIAVSSIVYSLLAYLFCFGGIIKIFTEATKSIGPQSAPSLPQAEMAATLYQPNEASDETLPHTQHTPVPSAEVPRIVLYTPFGNYDQLGRLQSTTGTR